MIQIDDTVISLDVLEEYFFCDLSACKGVCCVEGESGAPLEQDEIPILEQVLPQVWDDLSAEARRVIESSGVACQDWDDEYVTSIVNGKDCVFTYYDEDGICRCAIEKAYREGRIDFYKPVSCHLYPIRVTQYSAFRAVNYHRWQICKPAVALGNRKGTAVYQFLKEPLIRKFGEEWYAQLCAVAENVKNEKSG